MSCARNQNVLNVLLLMIVSLMTATTAHAQAASPRAEQPQVKVGDQWHWERSDRRTGIKEGETKRAITAISATQIDGTENDSKFTLSLDLMTLESSTMVASVPARIIEYPLEIGKKWDFKWAFKNKVNNASIRWEVAAEVVAFEKVRVPAGEFDAFKIEYKGFFNNETTRGNGRIRQTLWYAPAAKTVVKTEYDDGFNRSLTQLVNIQLQP